MTRSLRVCFASMCARRRGRFSFVVAPALLLLLLTREAKAQDMGIGGAGPGGAQSGPSGGRPDVVNSPETGEQPTLSKRSIKLFDSRKSIVSYQLDIGPIWNRRVQDTDAVSDRTNFKRGTDLASEIGFGTVYVTPQKSFYMVGELKTLFRIIDSKSFSWAIFHQELGGGLMLGPFEPELRLRLSVLSADIFHAEPSIQLLSPGVSAGFGIHLGKIRLDIKAHSEYLWRWFGPDYVVRGVTIGIRLDQTRPKNPFPGAPQQQ